MGPVSMCNTSLINSPDGWGYTPPVGCMSIPVLPDATSQALATVSTHISATGAANGEYDSLFNDR
jgi:hypothetical protein